MPARAMWLRAAPVVCAFVVVAGPASAQRTTTTETKKFTVVSVEGNQVVVTGEDGAKEYTVPEDFRFSVGGKQISVHELRPGMSGTATITTTTTVKPVSVTEVYQAEVVQASASSVIVRGSKGFQMFTESDIEKRGIKIMKDGKPVQFSDLNTRDRLTATIITAGTPQVLTDREVKARLSEAAPAAAAAASAPATVAPAASPAPAQSQPATVATQIATTQRSSRVMTVSVIGLIVLAVGVVWVLMRRREGA